MKVNSTELQNNFGKYLMLAAQEEIIVTRNGRAIARLSPIHEENSRNGVTSDRWRRRRKGTPLAVMAGARRPMRNICT